MSEKVECKQFSISYMAVSETHISHTAAVVCSRSLGRAIDFALEQAKKKYPEAEGWWGHSANGCAVMGVCALPCSMAFTSRPGGQRVDGRTGDGWSEGDTNVRE